MARSSPREPSHNPEPIRRRVRKAGPPVVSMSPKARDLIRGVLGFVLLIVFGLLGWLWYWWFTTGSWNAMRKHMPEFVDLTNPNPRASVSPIKKIVIVDVKARDLDPLHYDLPRKIRAEGPEEVTTIAQVRRRSEMVGSYTNGMPASKWTFEVNIVDRATKRVLESRSFAGGDPAYHIRSRRGSWSSGEGDMPIGMVLDYLAALPTRTFGP